MEFTEEELLAKYDKYVDEFPDYGDGPYIFEAWKQRYLAKRTTSKS